MTIITMNRQLPTLYQRLKVYAQRWVINIVFTLQDTYEYVYCALLNWYCFVLCYMLQYTKKQHTIVWAGSSTGINLTYIAQVYYATDPILSTYTFARWLSMCHVPPVTVRMLYFRNEDQTQSPIMMYSHIDLLADREINTNIEIPSCSVELNSLPGKPLII